MTLDLELRLLAAELRRFDHATIRCRLLALASKVEDQRMTLERATKLLDSIVEDHVADQAAADRLAMIQAAANVVRLPMRACRRTDWSA